MSIYDLKVKDSQGNEISLKDYKGKVLLIVNTATQCGFTPQYKGLQELYDKYHSSGLEILDFPCNQFANQAPGTNDEIRTFCELRFKTTFKQFAKVDVNGENASELFKYLKSKKGSIFNSDIKWNFTKFIVNKKGEVVKRYSPLTKPVKLEKKIKELL